MCNDRGTAVDGPVQQEALVHVHEEGGGSKRHWDTLENGVGDGMADGMGNGREERKG